MVKEMKKLNELSVKTWKWLNVNDLSLDSVDFGQIKKYDKEVVKSSNSKVTITNDIDKTLGLVNSNNLKTENIKYGVSEELVNLAENNYNSSNLIHIGESTKAEEPVLIEYVLDEKNNVLIDNNVIVAEKNSELTVIIKYSTDSDELALHNGIAKIYAKDGAKVTLIKIQNMNDKSKHFDSNVAFVGYEAKVKNISIEIGSQISVTNYMSDLEKTLAESEIKSIYFRANEDRIDLSYSSIHRAMRSKSNIETRGVLKDNAKKIFRGTLDFKKGAIKSVGAEEEHVILLSPTVKSDSIPLLLCSEDDVSGAHAASVGNIDENKLFYLMSRGFSEKEAKKLIIEGAFSGIIDEIKVEEIKEEVMDNIIRRFENE